ncbi:hypothetical protein H4R34_000442 [Dimargaris verticillata]|uniref:ATP-dependent RNA helicase n=1 Tax=Dimargaris verticillata TaxID=2761393 RepID=A0A9W8B599_9FUNG|nr:hypothetical protein H4R34_000442 [Dimargaris verticillata]
MGFLSLVLHRTQPHSRASLIPKTCQGLLTRSVLPGRHALIHTPASALSSLSATARRSSLASTVTVPRLTTAIRSYSSAQSVAAEEDLSLDRNVASAKPSASTEIREFDQVPGLSAKSKQVMREVFQYSEMSKVQQAVLKHLPVTKDLLVRAKTGTGKTLGFLLPAVEVILANSNKQDLVRGQHIGALIVSPTRELANQIATEAEKLAGRHRMGVLTAVGGTRRQDTVRKLKSGHRSDIVVGTPGRIIDLMQTSHEFFNRVKRCKLLILDEADELLNMGFRPDIEQIAGQLPQDRFGFLFSATLTPKIRQVANQVLRSDHVYVDAIDPEDMAVHQKVPQYYCQVPSDQYLHAAYEILERHRVQDGHGRVMVFLPTTALTQLYGEIFRRLSLPVFCLHSKLTQAQRERVSKQFRQTPGSILVTTDVSARGVDYPDVSLVLQLGIPQSRDQYIHRVGRTGRAGKSGQGIILLNKAEQGFLRQLHDIPMQPAPGYGDDFVAKLQETPSLLLQQQWSDRIGYHENELLHNAFTSSFGFYGSRRDVLSSNPHEIITHIQTMFQGLGFAEQPPVSETMLSRYGLRSRQRTNQRSQQQGWNSNMHNYRNNGSNGGGYGNRPGRFQNERSSQFDSRGGYPSNHRRSSQGSFTFTPRDNANGQRQHQGQGQRRQLSPLDSHANSRAKDDQGQDVTNIFGRRNSGPGNQRGGGSGRGGFF